MLEFISSLLIFRKKNILNTDSKRFINSLSIFSKKNAKILVAKEWVLDGIVVGLPFIVGCRPNNIVQLYTGKNVRYWIFAKCKVAVCWSISMLEDCRAELGPF